MPMNCPDPKRRQFLVRRGLEPLPLNAKTGELFDVIDFLFELVLTPDHLLHDDVGNPPEHHTTVLRYMMEIANGDNFEWKMIRQAAAIAILHDISPVRRITRGMIAALPKGSPKRIELEKKRAESVPIHMEEGSRQARIILEKLNNKCGLEVFEADDIDRICDVIAIHDNPKVGIPIPSADTLAAAFREADRLWMQDPWGILSDLERKGNYRPTLMDRVNQAEENVRSYRKEYDDAYYAYSATEFKDGTLFRTRTGYAIFKRLREYWEQERLRAGIG